MINEYGVSERQACRAVKLPRSTYQYKHKEKDDSEIITLLGELVDKHPSIGFWMCYYRLRNMGYQWKHKSVYRVYTAMLLNIRRRAKKRTPTRVKQALMQPERPNQVWSLDFFDVGFGWLLVLFYLVILLFNNQVSCPHLAEVKHFDELLGINPVFPIMGFKKINPI